MILQPNEWYQLGMEFGDVVNKTKITFRLITNKFGYTSKEAKLVYRLCHFKDKLQSNLDSEVCAAYPLNIEYLPNSLRLFRLRSTHFVRTHFVRIRFANVHLRSRSFYSQIGILNIIFTLSG